MLSIQKQERAMIPLSTTFCGKSLLDLRGLGNLLSLFSVFIVISPLFWHTVSQAQGDYFAAPHVYEFAEYLYREGDYLRAAGEYQRYLLLAVNSIPNDSTLFKIGECYRLGKQPERAIAYFQRIIEKNPQGRHRDGAAYQIAYSYFEVGQYHSSIRYIEGYLSPSSRYLGKLHNLLGINYLYLKEWEKAHRIFASHLVHSSTSSDSLTVVLNRLAREGTQLPHKSEIVAALMSASVPGSGKMYAHRFHDGLYSLFTVGLTGWQANDGFNKDGARSVKGWVYGTLGTILYLGNIYGSMLAVKIHNEEIEESFLDKVALSIQR